MSEINLLCRATVKDAPASGGAVIFPRAWRFHHNLGQWFSPWGSGDEWGKMIETLSTTGQSVLKVRPKALVKIICHSWGRKRQARLFTPPWVQQVSRVETHVNTLIQGKGLVCIVTVLLECLKQTHAVNHFTLPHRAADMLNIMEAAAAMHSDLYNWGEKGSRSRKHKAWGTDLYKSGQSRRTENCPSLKITNPPMGVSPFSKAGVEGKS